MVHMKVTQSEFDKALTYAGSWTRSFLSSRGMLEFDDLFQEARIAVIEASRRFDIMRGVPFHRYAQLIVRGRLLDYAREVDPLTRDHRRLIKRGDGDPVTIVELRSVAIGSVPDYASQIDHKRALNLALYRSGLTSRERDILILRASGWLCEELATRFGVNYSRIYQIYDRAVEKVRAAHPGLILGPPLSKSVRSRRHSKSLLGAAHAA